MPPKPEDSGASVQVQEAVAQPNLVQIPINIPLPSKLELTGNLATNWKKFHRDWNNYEIAARLKDPEHPAVNKSLRTATLLTCIGSDAVDVYEGLEFQNEDDKKDIDIVLQKLQRTRDTDLTGETKNQTSLWMLTLWPCARWRRRVTSEC